jgi:hypothetical protein
MSYLALMAERLKRKKDVFYLAAGQGWKNSQTVSFF